MLTGKLPTLFDSAHERAPAEVALTHTRAGDSPLELLPNEVLDQVACTLQLPDCSRLGLVSRRLRVVSLRDALWKPVTKPWEHTRPPVRADVSGGLHAFYSARRNQLTRSLQGDLCLQTPLGRPETPFVKTLIYPRSDLLIRITVDAHAPQAVSETQKADILGPSPARWKALPADLTQALGRCAVTGWGDDVVLVSADHDRAVVLDAETLTQRFEMRVGYGQRFYHDEALGSNLFALIDESRRLVAYRKDGTRIREKSIQLDDVCMRSHVQRGRDGHLVFGEPVGKFTTIVDVEKGETHRLILSFGDADGLRDALSRLRAFFNAHGYAAHEADAQINQMVHSSYGAPGNLAKVCGKVFLTTDPVTSKLSLYTVDDERVQATYDISVQLPKRYAHVGERYFLLVLNAHDVLTIDGVTGNHNVLHFEQTLSDAPSAIAAIDDHTAAVCMGDLAFIDLSATPSRILGIARSGEITRVTNAERYRIITNDANAVRAQLWDLCEPAEDTDFPFWNVL